MNMRILFSLLAAEGFLSRACVGQCLGASLQLGGRSTSLLGQNIGQHLYLDKTFGKVLKIFRLQILVIVIFPWNCHNHSLCHESTTSPAVLCFIQRFSRKSAKTSNMPIHQGLISKYGIEWPWAIVFDDDDVKDGTSWWSYRCCSIDCTIIIIYLMFWLTRWRFQLFMSGWMSLPKISESS